MNTIFGIVALAYLFLGVAPVGFGLIRNDPSVRSRHVIGAIIGCAVISAFAWIEGAR
jgi:hypothetical protein